MDVTRRHILKGLGCLAVAGAAGSKASELGSTGKIAGREASSASIPKKDRLKLRDDSTYINCAYTHPMPTAGSGKCASMDPIAISA